MYQLVRKTLETYLSEKRIPSLSEFPQNLSPLSRTKESVFVTLYKEGRVIASSGRIICKKENTLYECIDNTLFCLKDPRLALSLHSPENLKDIHIRTDRFTSENRRVLRTIDELDVHREGLIFLSQNLGLISVILPGMLHIDTQPQSFFSLACKKVGVDPSKLTHSDYVLYGFTTISEMDFVN